MSELPPLFEVRFPIGTIFFGGIIANFLSLSHRTLDQREQKPLPDRIAEIPQRVAQGGHGEKHDLLRALLRADCRVILSLCDRVLLDDFGLRLGWGPLSCRLNEMLGDGAGQEIGDLCRVRLVFAETFDRIESLSADELVRLQSGGLTDNAEAIPAGSQCFAAEAGDMSRESIVGQKLAAIDNALRHPYVGRSEQFEDPICPGGLPPKLAREIGRYPEGWWDFLRLAFREELCEPANEAARKAWEMHVLAHLPKGLGESYEDFERRQSLLDEKVAVAWNDLKLYREVIKNVINDTLQSQLSRRPFQLPARAMGGKLIGRDELLAELVQRLKRREHVVVCGGLGMGKSALAAEAVVVLVGDSDGNLATSRYPQGIVVLDCAKIESAEDFGPAWFYLAEQFGSRWLSVGSVDLVRQDFRRGHALVVIENAEEIADNRLRQFLESLPRGLTALVLTDKQFQLGEKPPLTLDKPLDAHESLVLLRTVYQSSKADESILTQMSEILAGNPLSLIWAGYQLAAGRETPGDFLKALRRQPLGDRSQSNQEHEKLPWLFDHVISQLSAEDRRGLAAAGMLSHYSFPLSAAVAVTRNLSSARQSLERLVAYGLLRRSDGTEEQWQFSHRIAHEYARSLGGAEQRMALGRWAVMEFDAVVKRSKAAGERSPLVALINDIVSMLRADGGASGFDALRHRLLHDGLEQVVQLELRDAARKLGLALLYWLRRAVEEWPTDVVLVSQLASSYEQLAEIDRDNARDNYQECIKITRQLLEGDPDNLVLQRTLMQRYDKLGDDYLFSGDPNTARPAFLKSLEISERLVRQVGGDTRRGVELAYSYSKLADLELAAANHDQSRALTQKAIDIAEAILAIEPNNDACAAILSDSHQRLSQLQVNAGDVEGARAEQLKALEIAERLARQNPANEGLQVALFWTYFNISQSDSMIGDQDARRTHLTQCRELEERMDAAQGLPPSESLSNRFLADLECADGNYAAARAIYEKRLEKREQAARADPTDSFVHRDLSFSYQELGGVEFAAGNLDGARQLFQKSLSICERLLAVTSDAILERELRLGLRNAYDSLADVEFATGNFDTARTLIRKELEINESLAKDNVLAQQALIPNLQKLGEVEAASGNLDGAITLLCNTIALCERLIESDPKTADWQHVLSVTCTKIGDVLERQNQQTEALEYFERAEAISAELVERDPTSTDWNAHLDSLRTRIEKLG